jgi:hypothetical protein
VQEVADDIEDRAVQDDEALLDRQVAEGLNQKALARACCGFDADAAGNDAADRMTTLYPRIKRLSPPAHDWSDALSSA